MPLYNPSAPIDATFITQTANGVLTAEQNLAALATGLLKNTTATGVLSTAAEGTDYFNPPFLDTNTLIKGSADPTKLFRFEIDGFTAGATRVMTPPNQDFLAAGQDFANVFTAAQTIDGTSDAVQLDIQAHSTQTSNLVTFRSSTPTVMAGITGTGAIWTGATAISGTPSKFYVTEGNISSPTKLSVAFFDDRCTNAPSERNVVNINMQASQTSAAFNGEHFGLLAEAWIRGTNTQNWTGNGISIGQFGLVGSRYSTEVRSGASGTIGWIQSLLVNGDFNSVATAAVTNWVGLRVFQPANNTITTTQYGIVIGDISSGITNNFAIQTNAGLVVFNEGGNANSDVRIEGDTDANLFFTDASADANGMGTNAPAAKLHVDQPSTTGAKPVVLFDQADVDEDFVYFIGTSDSGSADRSLVKPSDFTTPGALVAWLKCKVQDTRVGGIGTIDVWIPAYAIPTA